MGPAVGLENVELILATELSVPRDPNLIRKSCIARVYRIMCTEYGVQRTVVAIPPCINRRMAHGLSCSGHTVFAQF